LIDSKKEEYPMKKKWIVSLIALSTMCGMPLFSAEVANKPQAKEDAKNKLKAKQIAKGDGGRGGGARSEQEAQEEQENNEIINQDIRAQSMEMRRGKAG
jgi:hypothetical protein